MYKVDLVTMSRDSPYDNYLMISLKYISGYIAEQNRLITRSGIAEHGGMDRNMVEWIGMDL
jgi:hypothetical protein